jgi:cation:H+ antiporter
VAAAKKKDQLALGNVLGSNVFNILLILGTSAVVIPISTFSLTWVDLGVLLSSAVVVWLWTYTGHRDRIDRWEAVLMLLGFFGYYAWLFVKL